MKRIALLLLLLFTVSSINLLNASAAPPGKSQLSGINVVSAQPATATPNYCPATVSNTGHTAFVATGIKNVNYTDEVYATATYKPEAPQKFWCYRYGDKRLIKAKENIPKETVIIAVRYNLHC